MISINHIRLRSITAAHTFCADIPLTNGLNIIQADNTSGKSTCLQAIIYGLGLERSLGSSLEVPLPHAMRERIQMVKNGSYEDVIQSYVMLEVKNDVGEVVTIRRDIVGGNERKLVQTWPGRTIDGRHEGSDQKDFFLHDAGSAVRADGFHAYLSRFTGWELPNVPRFDGSECPLYMETLFPMFFVEQKRGWSTTQGPLPTFFRIQDLPRRVMEFILDLDAGKVRRNRAELRKQILHLEQRWRDKCEDLIGSAGSLVRVVGLPQSPSAEFSRGGDTWLSVYYRDEWVSIDTVSTNVAERAEELDKVEPTNADEAQLRVKERLVAAEDRNSDLTAQLLVLRQEHQLALAEQRSLEERVDALRVDLDRNRDAEKLQRLGSAIGIAASENACPTCHQEVSRELLPDADVQSMGLAENITFIKSQLDLYESMLVTSVGVLSGLRVRYRSIDEELSDVRAAIRGLKNDLLRPSSRPIRSELEELVRLQSRLEHWQSLQEMIDGSLDELRQNATDWVMLREEYKNLGSGELTASDKRKVRSMQTAMQGLLKSFGFGSFLPEEISLSDDNFRPQVVKRDDDGELIEKDIGFEASASDGIRLKWAYYLSLISLSQSFETNHLGMVVFDEPGQQHMKDVDLSTFLSRASANIGSNRQMIVSTSETLERVKKSVDGAEVNIQPFDGFILKPHLANS